MAGEYSDPRRRSKPAASLSFESSNAEVEPSKFAPDSPTSVGSIDLEDDKSRRRAGHVTRAAAVAAQQAKFRGCGYFTDACRYLCCSSWKVCVGCLFSLAALLGAGASVWAALRPQYIEESCGLPLQASAGQPLYGDAVRLSNLILPLPRALESKDPGKVPTIALSSTFSYRLQPLSAAEEDVPPGHVLETVVAAAAAAKRERVDVEEAVLKASRGSSGESQQFLELVRPEVAWAEGQTEEERALLRRALQRSCASLRTASPQLEVAEVDLVQHLDVYILQASAPYPQFGMNESYNLSIAAPVSVLVAVQVYGALRGLETFRQAIAGDGGIHGAPAMISDAPLYPWRGLMVDTSRHWLPLETLQRAIDAVSMSKLNVLHWHISDAQSFPLELKSRPELARKGAWAADKVYTPDDVRTLVEHARDRGVRIVPELDIPAHAASWGKGFPEILVHCDWLAAGNAKLQDKYALDPTKNKTYEVIKDVLTEVASMFPDNFMHLGGDEIDQQCWLKDEKIKVFMQEQKLVFKTLLSLFINRVVQFASDLNRRVFMWQGTFDVLRDLYPGVAGVQPWKCWRQGSTFAGEAALQAAAASKRAVVQSMCWYLDWDSSWPDYYSHSVSTQDRRMRPLEADQQGMLYGGEAAMWTENVDATNFDCRVWPRLPAIAERFWSPANTTDEKTAELRLVAHKERLRQWAGVEPALWKGPVRADGSQYRQMCPFISQDTQRPAKKIGHKIMLQNFDGGVKQPQLLALEEYLSWVRGRYLDVVLLSGVHEWDVVLPERGFTPRDQGMYTPNTPIGLSQRAKRLGFAFSVFMQANSGSQLVIASANPIEVIEMNRTAFTQGLMQVRTGGIVYLLCRLSDKSPMQRSLEAVMLSERVRHYNQRGEAAVVAGDFESLSKQDAAAYMETGLRKFIQSPAAPPSLWGKYVDIHGQLDYDPVETLLKESLHDPCNLDHWPEDKLDAQATAWQQVAKPPLSCSYTTPVIQSTNEKGVSVPPVRSDFIFVNDAYQEATGAGSCAVVHETSSLAGLATHFPVECRHVPSGPPAPPP